MLFGGLGNSESSTRTTVRNTNNAIAASDNALVSANRSTVHGNVRIDASPDVLLASLEAVTASTAKFTDALAGIYDVGTKQQIAAAVTNAQSQKDLVNATFDRLSALAESKQTEGESGRNKLVFYTSAFALAAVAAIFIFGKK